MALVSIQGRIARADASASGKLRANIDLASRATARTIAAAEIDVTDDALLAPALALLPPGRAFTAGAGSILRSTCDGLAREFSRLFRRADEVRRGAIPSSKGPLMADWADLLALQAGESASDRLSEGTLFSLALLGRRLVAFCLASDLSDLAPVVQIAPREPFRVGISRVGEPLRGDLWRYRLDVTLVVPSGYRLSGEAVFAALANSDALPAFRMWLLRAFPPWCALSIAIRKDGDETRPELLRINLPRRS